MDTTPKLPHQIWLMQLIKKHLTGLGVWNQRRLQLFVSALIQSQNISQTKVAVSCANNALPISDLRKYQRFLAQKIDVDAIEKQWVKCVLTLVQESWKNKPQVSRKRIIIIVDETARKQSLKVMILAMAYRGRTIPLVWRVYKNEETRQQTKMILEMIQVVTQTWKCLCSESPFCGEENPNKCFLVLADRGIGNSPELLRGFDSLGLSYLVRVTHLVQLKVNSKQLSLASLCSSPGQEGCLMDVLAFKKSGWLPCHAYWCWSASHKESWLLLSNSDDLSASTYGLRMWIELGIRDNKSSGWHWEKSKITDCSRCWLQWLLMSVANLYASLLGTWLLHSSDRSRCFSRGQSACNVRSVFRLGLDFVQSLSCRDPQWLLNQFPSSCLAELIEGKLWLTLDYPARFFPPRKTVAQ